MTGDGGGGTGRQFHVSRERGWLLKQALAAVPICKCSVCCSTVTHRNDFMGQTSFTAVHQALSLGTDCFTEVPLSRVVETAYCTRGLPLMPLDAPGAPCARFARLVVGSAWTPCRPAQHKAVGEQRRPVNTQLSKAERDSTTRRRLYRHRPLSCL